MIIVKPNYNVISESYGDCRFILSWYNKELNTVYSCCMEYKTYIEKKEYDDIGQWIVKPKK